MIRLRSRRGKQSRRTRWRAAPLARLLHVAAENAGKLRPAGRDDLDEQLQPVHPYINGGVMQRNLLRHPPVVMFVCAKSAAQIAFPPTSFPGHSFRRKRAALRGTRGQDSLGIGVSERPRCAAGLCRNAGQASAGSNDAWILAQTGRARAGKPLAAASTGHVVRKTRLDRAGRSAPWLRNIKRRSRHASWQSLSANGLSNSWRIFSRGPARGH